MRPAAAAARARPPPLPPPAARGCVAGSKQHGATAQSQDDCVSWLPGCVRAMGCSSRAGPPGQLAEVCLLLQFIRRRSGRLHNCCVKPAPLFCCWRCCEAPPGPVCAGPGPPLLTSTSPPSAMRTGRTSSSTLSTVATVISRGWGEGGGGPGQQGRAGAIRSFTCVIPCHTEGSGRCVRSQHAEHM
jgi:hypothetical protein